MTLIARKFRSQPQWNAVVGQCLSSIASATVRHLGATLVMVFGQVTDPQQFLWLGDRGDEDELARLALPPSLGDSLAQGLVGSSPSQRFTLLRASVDYPRQPFQVWSLEVHAPVSVQAGVLSALFAGSSMIPRDRRILALSLYRAAEPSEMVVGFFGLAWGATPNRIGLCLP